MRNWIVGLLVILATQGVFAEDPAGATINDTFIAQKANYAQLFYVARIDGKGVDNAWKRTRASKRGASNNAVGHSRVVPAKPTTLTLRAGTLRLGGFVSKLAGDVTFTPEPGAFYLVKGQLDGDYAAVWLETIDGEVVSNLVEMYAKGYDRLEESRNAILQGRVKESGASRATLFAQIANGEGAELVRQKFGEPDKVEEIPGNIFAERPPRTQYTYNGLGTILFTQVKKPGFLLGSKSVGLSVTRVNPELAVEAIDPDEAKVLIGTDNAETLQKIAQSYHRAGLKDPEVLDLMAARLLADHRTDSIQLISALSWICNTLGASGNGRYQPLLLHVAEKAERRKLRRYALKAAKSLPEGNSEPFTF